MSEETIPDMRETIDRLRKERNTERKEVTRLTGELHVRDAREAFRTGGYDPRHGDLFASKQPDMEITEENVTAFADEWNLAAVSKETSSTDGTEEKTSEVEDGSEALAGMAGSGTTSGEGGAGVATSEKMTRQEWQKLMFTDPAKAKAAATSGQVELSDDNPWIRRDRNLTPSGDNPYASLQSEST